VNYNPYRSYDPVLDVLVIAPHPDDAEIGLGGSIARMLSEGLGVGILDLTDGEPTPFGSRELRQRETEAASRVLGISWRRCLGLPNRNLENTIESRWSLAGVIREVRPRILFAPYWEDAHPDHVAASALVDAARFWGKLTKSDIPGEPHWAKHIFYYFSVHLKLPERPSFVLDVSEHLETKLQAVRCYTSQFSQPVKPGAPDVIASLQTRASYWGWMIGAQYGEPFASREPIGLSSIGGLTR
jgi:N-acetylglucosamine malate deacetylase 1